jgi:MFS transporter, ACS family, tartrate transporter
MVEASTTGGLTHEITGFERQTMARVAWRLLPLLIACYFVAYLDRVNVGFASLTMNKALGFSSAVYGFGGGIFFLGYFIFEVPSNVLLGKIGARVWIARILITWGIIAACTAFITGPLSFYTVRFLLGVAEAGFFPGIILYLTWWFPSYYRSRIVGVFMAAIPLSNILGSVVSGFLLDLDGWLGFAGWQWLFLLEALPAVVLGFVFWVYMTDWPSQAHWLAPEQRNWLTGRLDAERARREAIRHYSLKQALLDKRVLLLSLVYFGGTFAGYGIVLFQPQIVHRLTAGFGMTGLINAIPLCIRGVRHGAVGPSLRPHRGETATCRLCLRGRRSGSGRHGYDDRSGADHGHPGDRRYGPILHRSDLLEPADGDAVRHGGSRRHRADQRAG